VGAALATLMPVERLELLIAGGVNDQAYRLDGHGQRRAVEPRLAHRTARGAGSDDHPG
jgi:hypothetical protein